MLEGGEGGADGEEDEEDEEEQQGDRDQLGQLDRVEMLQNRWRAVISISKMRLLQHHLRGSLQGKTVNTSNVKSDLAITIEDGVLLMVTNASASLAEVQQPSHPPHLGVTLQIHPCTMTQAPLKMEN